MLSLFVPEIREFNNVHARFYARSPLSRCVFMSVGNVCKTGLIDDYFVPEDV